MNKCVVKPSPQVNDKCVLLGPEFVVPNNNNPVWNEANLVEFELKLNTLTGQAANANFLIMPGTIVFTAKSDVHRQEKDKAATDLTDPNTPALPPNQFKAFTDLVTRKLSIYWFNMAIVSFRGQPKIRHCKKTDHGTSSAPYAFDLNAKVEFKTPSKHLFDTGDVGWGSFSIEICGDHGLHECNDKKKATKTPIKVHLAVFNPGSIEMNKNAVCASNNGFVFENIAGVGTPGRGEVYKVTRPSEDADASAIEAFRTTQQQVVDKTPMEVPVLLNELSDGQGGLKVWEYYHA